MHGYPIELDLRGRTVLVVGLGAVGRRKAAGLSEAGASIIGVDPAPDRTAGSASGFAFPFPIEVRAEPYRAAHLDGVALAFASATSAVNRVVVADARRAGVWACSSSDPGAGDFAVPAVWRDGPLTLTVATSGASPALASALRDRAARALGPAAAGLAALLAELRPEVLARIDAPATRRRVMTDWADPRWLDLWIAEGPDAVRRALARALDDAADGDARDPTRPCQNPAPPR